MTVRPPGSKFDLAKGSKKKGEADPKSKPMAMPAGPDHAGMKMAGSDKGVAKHPGHSGHQMKSPATRPQIAAFGLVSVFALVTGMLAPWNWINMRLSARDVGGAIMPPGMVMERDLSGDAMRDMAAADPNKVSARYGVNARGDQPLAFRMENGVKVST